MMFYVNQNFPASLFSLWSKTKKVTEPIKSRETQFATGAVAESGRV